MLELYRRLYPDLNPAERLIAITTDCNFRIRSLVLAQRRAAKARGPVWMYSFEWETPVLGGRLKSPHAMDVPFTFNTLDLTNATGGGADAQALSDTMSSVWAAFARNGTPRHASIPEWPRYDQRRSGNSHPGQAMPNRERSSGRRPAAVAGHHRNRLATAEPNDQGKPRMEVQTVTGTIGLDQLGRTLMHEHLFIAFPGAEFDPSATFDRAVFIAEAVRRLRQLRVEHGVRSFVDPCPIELGRDAALMREIADKVRNEHHLHHRLLLRGDGPAGLLARAHGGGNRRTVYTRDHSRHRHDGGQGGGDQGGDRRPRRSPPLEHKFLEAACIAQQATNVPIITHTQDGCAGPEQQEAFASGGVPAHRCLIGHCCGNADPAYHRRVVDGGSYIGFDRIGILRLQPDEVRADNLVRLVRSGHRAQIMMSQDRHCGWLGKFARQVPPEEQARIDALRAAGNWPPPYTYLFTDFVPMLKDTRPVRS